MTLRLIGPILALLGFSLFVIWRWQIQRLARRRFLATITMLAHMSRTEVAGQPVEHWLGILNQEVDQPIVGTDAMVLTYKDHDFFFVDGGIVYATACTHLLSYNQEKGFFLIAIGQSAVRLLTNEEHVFRRIMGSTELALFSIFRWSAFASMLTAEKK